MQSGNAILGIFLALTAGVLLGGFALPMKKIRDWRWENTWLAYCFWGLIVFCWIFALISVPGLLSVILGAPLIALAPVFLFGAGWGAGCVLFGLALDKCGMALATAIVLGMNNALGALVPVLLFHREQLASRLGLTLVSGVALMVSGVALCAWAGSAREGSLEQAGNPASARTSAQVRKGVLLAISAGVLGTLFNFAVVFGDPLRNLAERAGTPPVYANNAIWCVSLLGGFVINAGYCGYLLSKKRGWALYTSEQSGRNWPLSVIMGGTWMAGVVIYGMAVSKLGRFGPSIGWALIQSTAILAGNVVGLATGEWKNAGDRFRVRMTSGLAVLFAGLATVAASALV